MEHTEMIEFLKQGTLRVILDNKYTCNIKHTCNNNVIYFYSGNSSYTSYNNHNPEDQTYQDLLIKLNRITRIEKMIDFEYYPIWTKEDGEITQTENFVKLNGKYYTIKFLEQLLDKINEFKKINT